MDRLRIFEFVVFGFAIAIILRLFYWQFLAGIEKHESSDFQNEIPATQGEIFTSDGFPLVTNQQAFLIYGKPQSLNKNPLEVAQLISPQLISEKFATYSSDIEDSQKLQKEEELKKKEEEITEKLNTNNLFWVLLGRKVPLELKDKIQSYNIQGIGFEADNNRLYPEASLAAHLLGFVGSDKLGRNTGYFGLEGFYNRQLRGKPGRASVDVDPLGIPILVGNYRAIEPKPGSSLFLTIDRTVQFIVEKKLREAVVKYQAKEGTVVIADPKSGSILAMASYPNYNPAYFSEFDEKLYKNPAIAETYEPGSTFKVITMAAALDLSVITPADKCPVCSGPRTIGGYEISTWNRKYYPDSTMAEIIQHSDNVGMSYVGEKIGLDRFHAYITKFGFGEKTGVDLQEEADGVIRGKKDWYPIDLVTASFGQGIAVTPIQIVQAVCAIANGGKLISPSLVTKIVDGVKVEVIKKAKDKQIISPKTAAQVTEMMVNAVEFGEAQAFKPKGYRIAGKTGTAQIPVAGHYDPNKTVASFVGFAPANDPKFVMLVRFTEPTTSQFGSETAAPTFFSIAKELFNYYGIAPDK